MDDHFTPPPARIRVRVRTLAPPKDDYEVGYCRPPEKTRFKKGKSGNAKGRPKGSRNTATLLRAELNKLITATVEGRVVRISRLEAIIRRLIERCLSGDLKAISLLLKYDAGFPYGAQGGAAPSEEPLSAAERAIFDRLVTSAKLGPEGEP